MFADTKKLVVIGVDGRAESLAALRWSLREAVAMEARVEVVHSYLPQALTDLGFSRPHELHTASTIMLDNEVRTALTEMSEPPPVQTVSLPEDPATVLLDRARDASLLVLGVHRNTAPRDLILGRVAQACLRHALCPVVIVGLDNDVVRHETVSSMPVAAG